LLIIPISEVQYLQILKIKLQLHFSSMTSRFLLQVHLSKKSLKIPKG